MLGVAHTVPAGEYLACPFTSKVLLFPDVIQPFGWPVVEYSNEGSASKAHEHVVILTKDRLRELSWCHSPEDTLDVDNDNNELKREFQRVLVEKIQSRAAPGDVICHVSGPNLEIFDLLRHCHHIELSVTYTTSPGLPFRVFETGAWMHWHYGKAGQEDGNSYKWVVPAPIDVDRWRFCEEPDDYALYLGLVTPRQGIDILVEIAKRSPDLPIRVYGPGDPSPWVSRAPPNLIFKGPIRECERAEVMGRARCILNPTYTIEPSGRSGIEAQLCGVPLIGTSYGALQETMLEGITGYRCHTLADWLEAVRLSKSLDRKQIAAWARNRYSKESVGKQYDWVLRQLRDLTGSGWYAERSRKFAIKRRIWLFLPYFGAFPNYFQLYLDSLRNNAGYLSVFLISDNDLSEYRLPDNLIVISTTLATLRQKIARFFGDEFHLVTDPDTLLKSPYKICDFRIIYPILFSDIIEQYGVTEDDFVGWGDCDLIFGRFSDFLDRDNDYHVIGGFHGHLTAFRNTAIFRTLFRKIMDLPALLLDDKSHIIDEVAFRQPLLDCLAQNRYSMFYTNRYFCDIVPRVFFGLYRTDHAQREKNFFDAYNPQKEISYVRYDRDGRLTIFYDDGDSRPSLYCHLQKRIMALHFERAEEGYYIGQHAFSLSQQSH